MTSETEMSAFVRKERKISIFTVSILNPGDPF